MSEFITHSREETVALGERLAQHLAPGALIAFTMSVDDFVISYFTAGLARARRPSARALPEVSAAPTRSAARRSPS